MSSSSKSRGQESTRRHSAATLQRSNTPRFGFSSKDFSSDTTTTTAAAETAATTSILEERSEREQQLLLLADATMKRALSLDAHSPCNKSKSAPLPPPTFIPKASTRAVSPYIYISSIVSEATLFSPSFFVSRFRKGASANLGIIQFVKMSFFHYYFFISSSGSSLFFGQKVPQNGPSQKAQEEHLSRGGSDA